jgi:hypothetical protein
LGGRRGRGVCRDSRSVERLKASKQKEGVKVGKQNLKKETPKKWWNKEQVI